MIDLNDFRRQRNSEKLRAYMYKTDAKFRASVDQSKLRQEEFRLQREANLKAAESLDLSIGDRVQIRLHRHAFDGVIGEIASIKQLPNGRQLFNVLVTFERNMKGYKLPAITQSIPVEAELLHKVLPGKI